jgi:polar amino acid transport system ATP-binding protein
MLHLTEVYKQFNNKVVLDKIDLSIQKNTIVGLAGSSGSGKSTLLRCIQQLESPDSGTIHFTGTSGFMFQDFQLFPHMTVLKNLMYAPSLHQKSVEHAKKAFELLDILGLADKGNAYPLSLSGGQKQRVALARSLMMRPDLLLCDEPTSGLDVATTEEVISLLQTVKRMGVTMIIASHDLEFLTKIADRVVVIKLGLVHTDIQVAEFKDLFLYLKQQY